MEKSSHQNEKGLPTIRFCRTEANPLPSLYNKACFECENINKQGKDQRILLHSQFGKKFLALKSFLLRRALAMAMSIWDEEVNT